MKSAVISVLMLSMAFFLVSCDNEGQLTQSTSDNETQRLSKKPTSGELITFEGNFAGSGVIVGGFPNAGPYPEYSMTLADNLPSGTYDGQLFMNVFGRGQNRSYIVQFWTEEMFLEVIGGVIYKDKKNQITTVTFTNEQCDIWIDDVLTETVDVSFSLTRMPQ